MDAFLADTEIYQAGSSLLFPDRPTSWQLDYIDQEELSYNAHHFETISDRVLRQQWLSHYYIGEDNTPSVRVLQHWTWTVPVHTFRLHEIKLLVYDPLPSSLYHPPLFTMRSRQELASAQAWLNEKREFIRVYERNATKETDPQLKTEYWNCAQIHRRELQQMEANEAAIQEAEAREVQHAQLLEAQRQDAEARMLEAAEAQERENARALEMWRRYQNETFDRDHMNFEDVVFGSSEPEDQADDEREKEIAESSKRRRSGTGGPSKGSGRASGHRRSKGNA